MNSFKKIALLAGASVMTVLMAAPAIVRRWSSAARCTGPCPDCWPSEVNCLGGWPTKAGLVLGWLPMRRPWA